MAEVKCPNCLTAMEWMPAFGADVKCPACEQNFRACMPGKLVAPVPSWKTPTGATWIAVGVVGALGLLLGGALSSSDGTGRPAGERLTAAACVLVPFVCGLGFYLAPTLIASRRGHPNSGPIVVVNVLLGWTLIGWVVALAWSLSADQVTPPGPGRGG